MSKAKRFVIEKHAYLTARIWDNEYNVAIDVHGEAFDNPSHAFAYARRIAQALEKANVQHPAPSKRTGT